MRIIIQIIIIIVLVCLIFVLDTITDNFTISSIKEIENDLEKIEYSLSNNKYNGLNKKILFETLCKFVV